MLYNSSSDGIYNPRFISIVASQMIGCVVDLCVSVVIVPRNVCLTLYQEMFV